MGKLFISTSLTAGARKQVNKNCRLQNEGEGNSIFIMLFFLRIPAWEKMDYSVNLGCVADFPKPEFK